MASFACEFGPFNAKNLQIWWILISSRLPYKPHLRNLDLKPLKNTIVPETSKVLPQVLFSIMPPEREGARPQESMGPINLNSAENVRTWGKLFIGHWAHQAELLATFFLGMPVMGQSAFNNKFILSNASALMYPIFYNKYCRWCCQNFPWQRGFEKTVPGPKQATDK